MAIRQGGAPPFRTGARWSRCPRGHDSDVDMTMRDQRPRVGPLIEGRGIPRWMYAPRTFRVGGVIRQWPPPPSETPRQGRPIYRVWWAWVLLGSVVVVLASITFVAKSESATVTPPTARVP